MAQLSLLERGELDAAAGVAGGWWRGRMAGSNGEATTGMPPVVPKDSRERAPSGRGFTNDTDDDSAVGLEGMPVSGAEGARRVTGNPRRGIVTSGSAGDGNWTGGTSVSDGGDKSLMLVVLERRVVENENRCQKLPC